MPLTPGLGLIASTATFAGGIVSLSAQANLTISANGNTILLSAGGGGGGGGSFSAGVSTGGNTLGSTGTVSGQLVFVGTNGITLSQSSNGASGTITISGITQSSQSAIRAFGVTNTGTTLGNTGVSTGIDWVVAGSGNITASQSTAVGGPNTVWLSVPAQTVQPAINGFGVSNTGTSLGNTGTSSGIVWVVAGSGNITASQSTAVGGPNTVWLSVPASVAQTNQQMTMFATGNTTQSSTGTTNASSLIFNGLGGVSVGISNGSVVLSGPVDPYVSSFENIPGGLQASIQAGLVGGSISLAVAFNAPQKLSYSFLRMPILMTTNSTTIATIASATATASGAIFSTWNAVFYSMGSGANSKSLQSVASGSAGFTFLNSISITNSTQYSITQGFSAQINGAGTTRTTQYSISNTNYSFTTNQIATEFSSARMLDVPFAGSLSQGAYWALIGASTSSTSAGAGGLAALTNCNVRYSQNYVISQANISFGLMGSTDMTSGGLMGAGSFSTAGGGTTNSLPVSAVSSIGSLLKVYFQLLRSA